MEAAFREPKAKIPSYGLILPGTGHGADGACFLHQSGSHGQKHRVGVSKHHCLKLFTLPAFKIIQFCFLRITAAVPCSALWSGIHWAAFPSARVGAELLCLSSLDTSVSFLWPAPFLSGPAIISRPLSAPCHHFLVLLAHMWEAV